MDNQENNLPDENTKQAEPQEETAGAAPAPRGKKRRRFNKSVILGAVVLVFAVIGVISTVIFLGNKTYDLIDNTAQKEEFGQFIYPLVMLDPPPFDSVDKLDERTLLTAAIWNLLKNEDTSKYPQDEFGFITVPQTDVDSYAAKLFGQDVKVNHQSISDSEYTFDYSPDTQSYVIPSTPTFPPYTPRVEKIERSGSTYRLTVDYIPAGDVWSQDLRGKKYEPEPAKTLYYDLERVDGGYRITAVRTINSGSDASSAAEVSSLPAESSDIVSDVTDSSLPAESGVSSGLMESGMSSEASSTSSGETSSQGADTSQSSTSSEDVSSTSSGQ